MVEVGTVGTPDPAGHPLWLRACRVPRVAVPRDSARHWSSTGRRGASTLPARAAGSHSTRHKHLEHTRACPSQTRYRHTWARTYACYPRAVQAAGWYGPPLPTPPMQHCNSPTPTLLPHRGAVVAHLGGQALPAKPGTAISSVGTAQHCCLPCSRAGGWGALKPGQGVMGAGGGGPGGAFHGAKGEQDGPAPPAATSERYQWRHRGLHQPACSEPSGDTWSPTSISGAGCTGS